MSLWPASLRSRLTLWYTAFLGMPFILLAVACYLVFGRTLRDRTDHFIGDALTVFARELGAERRAASGAMEAMRTTVNEVRFRDLQIVILDASGRIAVRTAPHALDSTSASAVPADLVDRIAAALRGQDLTMPTALTLRGEAGGFRVLSRPLFLGGTPYALTGTYSLRDNEEMLDRIRGIFLIAIPLLLLTAATGGSFLAKRSLAPVSAMAVHAARISPTTLHERLPVGGGHELAQLAEVVNDLLDRLEQAFAQQRRFVADASHELRTPTAILRTEADVALSREHRAEGEYRAALAVVQDASQRLGRIVDDLFLLARADSGHLVPRREPLYLEELVQEAARAVRSVATRHGVRIELGSLAEAPLRGDADLIGRSLLNLLDNAIKHSPRDGVVSVTLDTRADWHEVTVTDAGPGIPPDARDRIFERFFRVDAARSRAESSATSGAGLGLAIARRIAELHGGRLELGESQPGRTVFRLVLPLEAA
jgi:two-component system OmpR family sensor kinase